MNDHEKGFENGYRAAIHDAGQEGSRAFEEITLARWFGKAESVSVDSDEGRFTLEIETNQGYRYSFDIHGIDLDAFYDQVKARIGPYLQEADAARRTLPNDLDAHLPGGYDPSDPKHENFHSVHADIWDARAGK